jgi:hypothetical protein
VISRNVLALFRYTMHHFENFRTQVSGPGPVLTLAHVLVLTLHAGVEVCLLTVALILHLSLSVLTKK